MRNERSPRRVDHMRVNPLSRLSGEFVAALFIAIVAWAVPMTWQLRTFLLAVAAALVADLIRRAHWPMYFKVAAWVVSATALAAMTLPTAYQEYRAAGGSFSLSFLSPATGDGAFRASFRFTDSSGLWDGAPTIVSATFVNTFKSDIIIDSVGMLHASYRSGIHDKWSSIEACDKIKNYYIGEGHDPMFPADQLYRLEIESIDVYVYYVPASSTMVDSIAKQGPFVIRSGQFVPASVELHPRAIDKQAFNQTVFCPKIKFWGPDNKYRIAICRGAAAGIIHHEQDGHVANGTSG